MKPRATFEDNYVAACDRRAARWTYVLGAIGVAILFASTWPFIWLFAALVASTMVAGSIFAGFVD
jgi:uncharacterized membrane protein YdcZ (DUF606 family)